MGEVPETLQALRDHALEIVGVEREPLWAAPFQTTNRLQRSLASLVGYDGQFSRLLHCSTDGKLHVTDSVSQGLMGSVYTVLIDIRAVLEDVWSETEHALQTKAV